MDSTKWDDPQLVQLSRIRTTRRQRIKGIQPVKSHAVLIADMRVQIVQTAVFKDLEVWL
jgi:hypothetical protein